jgi:hypothetical protein
VVTLLDDSGLLGEQVRIRGAEVVAWDGVGPAPGGDVVVSLLALGFTDAPRVLDAIRDMIAGAGAAAHVVFSASSPPLVEGLMHGVLRRRGLSSPWLGSLMSEAVISAALDRGHVISRLRDVGRFDSGAQLWRTVAEEGPLAAELAGLPGDLIGSVRTELMAALAPSTRPDGTLLLPITARLLSAPAGIV